MPPKQRHTKVWLLNAVLTGALIALSIHLKVFEGLFLLVPALGIFLKLGFQRRRTAICRFAGFEWDLNDFCRGWIITGKTGSGKTTAAITPLIYQVSKNVPNWGGLAIDDKGSYWETLKHIFGKVNRLNDLILLEIVPSEVDPYWQPTHTLNIFDTKSIPYSAYARLICDVVASMGQKSGETFFKTQALVHIEYVLRALDTLKKPVTLKACFDFLTSDSLLLKAVEKLQKLPSLEAKTVANHFRNNFFNQPDRQLASVKSTIFNYLKFFNNPDIEKVFCPVKATVSIEAIDQGKVICLSLPQKYHEERKYFKALLKFLFYMHALKRFDLSEHERRSKNLIILWADEAQKIVTASEEGISDYNVVDELREARATLVAATQSYQSLIPAIGDLKKTQVFVANLANRITFSAADEESAQIAAEAIGKKKTRKETISYQKGGRSRSYTEEEKFHIEPHEIRNLKKFQAVVQHCDKGFKKVKLKPMLFQ